jgi:probable HAF family extracellular repeat protein
MRRRTARTSPRAFGALAAFATLAGACADPVAPSAPAAGPARVVAPAAGAPLAASLEITATDLRPLGLERTPVALNARGELVGSCMDRVQPGANYASAAGTNRAFVWSEAGGYRDLGTLGGGASCAAAINDRGHVVGYSQTASGAIHAFVWTPEGGMRDLGTLPGGTRSRALDISDAGQVVGSSDDATGVQQAVLWAADGAIQSLGRLPDRVVLPGTDQHPPSVWQDGGGSVASAINERGQVVGWARGVRWPVAGPEQRNFLWTAAGGIRDLTTEAENQNTAAGSNYALDINASGIIAGVRIYSGERRGVRLDATGAYFGGEEYRAVYTGVNDAGQVVGYRWDNSSTAALFVDASERRELAPPAGTVVSGYPTDVVAYAINGGTIVGRVQGVLGAHPGTPAARWTVGASAAPALLVDRNSGKCVDVLGEDRTPGTRVVIWPCHGRANQQWTLPAVGATGEVRVFGDRCLDAYGAAGRDGDALVVWECHGGANQQWTRTAAGELRGAGGKCADVVGAYTDDLAPLHLWPCHGGANQLFEARGAPTVASTAALRRSAAPARLAAARATP